LREEEVVYKGHVKWFNDRKGWGFATGNDGPGYLVHQRDVLSGGWKVLREGEPVVFELAEKGSRGRAIHTRLILC
jgi:CspA family cold shock protein